MMILLKMGKILLLCLNGKIHTIVPKVLKKKCTCQTFCDSEQKKCNKNCHKTILFKDIQLFFMAMRFRSMSKLFPSGCTDNDLPACVCTNRKPKSSSPVIVTCSIVWLSFSDKLTFTLLETKILQLYQTLILIV